MRAFFQIWYWQQSCIIDQLDFSKVDMIYDECYSFDDMIYCVIDIAFATRWLEFTILVLLPSIAIQKDKAAKGKVHRGNFYETEGHQKSVRCLHL